MPDPKQEPRELIQVLNSLSDMASPERWRRVREPVVKLIDELNTSTHDLAKALRTYGGHDLRCGANWPANLYLCTCGWDEVKKKLLGE